MRFEVENGDYVGTVEWRGPGDVAVQMDDPQTEQWFSRYFRTEDSFMGGAAESGQMECEAPHDSAEAFQRAAYRLAGHAYKVRSKGDARRHTAYKQGRAE